MPQKELCLLFKKESLIIRANKKNLNIFILTFDINNFIPYLCSPIKNVGFVAQLDRAPDYGSGGLGFESLRDHLVQY
jgi:hypothetical protein